MVNDKLFFPQINLHGDYKIFLLCISLSQNHMQIDPELSRTVVVSTKLDTKIPQFARASDVEVFLSPPASTLDGFMLGDSPFFTSVPSGRVGLGHESVFRSNDEFKQVGSFFFGLCFCSLSIKELRL